jgi:MFS family permease
MKLTARVEDPNVWRVYKATLGLAIGYGMALSLIAIYLDAKAFSKGEIGSLALTFGLGIVAFSLLMDRLLGRFGGRAMLVTSFFGYAVTVSVFPFLDGFWPLAALRFFDGAFSVGIWVSAETILLSRAGAGNEAFTMSLYALAMAVGYVLGPGLSWLLTRVAPLSAGFVAAGLLSSLSGAYLFFRLQANSPSSGTGKGTELRALDPAQDEERRSWGQLLWRIKNSCFATFAYGYFQASVVLFLPLYLMQSKGISEGQTIWIPAFFAAGMLLFTNAAGLIGDRVGHLRTMRSLAAIGMLMLFGFVFLDSYPWMAAAVFIAGASLASISPVSLALQGVSVRAEDYGRTTSIYNGFYALGMLIGPKISAEIFDAAGGVVMLYHLAALWGAFIVFSLVFYGDDPAVASKSGLHGPRRKRTRPRPAP